jgi:predicted deacylase
LSDLEEICGVPLKQGTKKIGYLNIAKMADGSNLRIAVHVIVGSGSGPKLALISTIHGQETLGIDIIKEIVSTIDLSKLSGTIVAIPVANPLAYQNGTYSSPLFAMDTLNLNHGFPGNMEGYLNEKIAYNLAHEIVDKVDNVINIHGGDEIISNNFGFVQPPNEEIQKAFGQEILFLLKPGMYSAGLGAYANSKNVPSIVPELGASPTTAKEYTRIGVKGVLNVMKYLKMIPGEPEKPKKQVLIKERTILRAKHGGIFYSNYGGDKVGLELSQGTFLGTIVDPHTFEVLQTVKAPFKRNILMLCRERSKIVPGDYMFTIGNLESAEFLI